MGSAYGGAMHVHFASAVPHEEIWKGFLRSPVIITSPITACTNNKNMISYFL